MRTKTIMILAAAAVLTAAAAGAAAAQGPVLPVKGKVVLADQQGASFEQKLDFARDTVRRMKQGDVFFIGYLFPSRNTLCHDRSGSAGPFEVVVDKGSVKFRGGGDGDHFESGGTAGPAGLLLLYSATPAKAGGLAVHLFDPQKTYDFKTVPVFWLGSADAEKSVAFLTGEFERGAEKFQEALIFAVSQHQTPRALDFLKTTARDDSRSLDLRKNAVFWIGANDDPGSVGLLREILAEAREGKLKEHVVFALTLTDRPEGIAEIIRAAKSDPDLEVRKQAIFWLGQKASQESAKTLQDVVDRPEEDLDIKESAVFAIFQLPKEQAVPMLTAIARENRSPAVRKKAIFWLGQTGDAEALKLFEEILLKKR